MSGPDDTLPPPPSSRSQIVEPQVPIIPAGFAQREMSLALSRLVDSVMQLEEVAMAVARALDEGGAS